MTTGTEIHAQCVWTPTVTNRYNPPYVLRRGGGGVQNGNIFASRQGKNPLYRCSIEWNSLDVSTSLIENKTELRVL